MGILRELYDRILADTESDSDASGYLSWKGEWHSAAFGLAIGILSVLTGRWEILGGVLVWLVFGPSNPGWLNLPYPRQFAKESLYVMFHTLAGIAIGIALQVWVL